MAKKQSNSSNSKNSVEYRQVYKSFASISASVATQSSSSNTSESRLRTMLKNPAKNATQIAEISRNTKFTNGMYKRVVKYMSSLLTYDHVLYPVIQNPAEYMNGDSSELQESFANTAIYIDRLNPKFHLPLFVEKLFTYGSVYMYKVEDKKSIAYMEFPIKLCRISYMEDGVYRFQMDITKLSDSSVLTYPSEIQSAYQSYKNGNTSNLIDGTWLQVSDKGVAFTVDSDAMIQSGMSLPPFAHSLLDTIKIENAKEGMEGLDKLDNSKIIHSKIETDDKGRPTMELGVVKEYHNSLKKALPEGSVAITNPFETKAINLSGTGKNSKFELLDKSVDQFYKGTGVSPQLFADDNSSSQALERSIQVDSQWLYSFVLPMFTNYYNYELSKAVKKKAFSWRIKFLEITYFDRSEAIKTAKDQLSYGGSRLEYLAYTGMTPVQIANMLIFEQKTLKIDDFMVAKSTSYTQSGEQTSSESEGEVGRPESEDPTDGTIRIKDAE